MKEQSSISQKEIPKTRNALEEKYKAENESAKRLDPDNIQDQVDQLPEPVGYRMLVLPFTPKEKTKGGIIFSQESLDKARIATNCGYVIKIIFLFNIHFLNAIFNYHCNFIGIRWVI